MSKSISPGKVKKQFHLVSARPSNGSEGARLASMALAIGMLNRNTLANAIGVQPNQINKLTGPNANFQKSYTKKLLSALAPRFQ